MPAGYFIGRNDVTWEQYLTFCGATDLPDVRAAKPNVDGPTELPAEGIDLDRLVSDFERAWVARALEKTGGVRKHAAVLLGISFRSLRYRLAKLGFDKGDDKLDDDPEA